MNENVKLTDAEIEKLMDASNRPTKAEIVSEDAVSDKKIRNFLVIGCGDGGCNIASQIKQAMPFVKVIAYNTTERAMDRLHSNINIVPLKLGSTTEKAEDGSGKKRDYSQAVFKQGSYKQVLAKAAEYCNADDSIEYILITTTTDGGTGGGVSPMVAKFIHDNLQIPTIILGVYPSLTEDASAMYNVMCWQSEVEKIGLPYIVLSNQADNDKMNKLLVHNIVNQQATEIVRILTGVPFGNTNISAVDNRDMYMLLGTMTGRISVVGSTDKLSVGKSVDDYLIERFEKSQVVVPANVGGLALFVKGPSDMISKADTSLSKFCAVYGMPKVKYTHIEESKDIYIAVVCVGCSEPAENLAMFRQRYDEVMDGINVIASVVDQYKEGMESPMSGGAYQTKRHRFDANSEVNISALDL